MNIIIIKFELNCHIHSRYGARKSVRLRDTFAGKNLTEIRRRETDSEKVQNFYRQKCRAGVRTKLIFLVNNGVWPQIYTSENHGR